VPVEGRGGILSDLRIIGLTKVISIPIGRHSACRIIAPNTSVLHLQVCIVIVVLNAEDTIIGTNCAGAFITRVIVHRSIVSVNVQVVVKMATVGLTLVGLLASREGRGIGLGKVEQSKRDCCHENAKTLHWMLDFSNLCESR